LVLCLALSKTPASTSSASGAFNGAGIAHLRAE